MFFIFLSQFFSLIFKFLYRFYISLLNIIFCLFIIMFALFFSYVHASLLLLLYILVYCSRVTSLDNNTCALYCEGDLPDSALLLDILIFARPTYICAVSQTRPKCCLVKEDLLFPLWSKHRYMYCYRIEPRDFTRPVSPSLPCPIKPPSSAWHCLPRQT